MQTFNCEAGNQTQALNPILFPQPYGVFLPIPAASFSYCFLMSKAFTGLGPVPIALRSMVRGTLSTKTAQRASREAEDWLPPPAYQIATSEGMARTSAFCLSPPGDPNVPPGLKTCYRSCLRCLLAIEKEIFTQD